MAFEIGGETGFFAPEGLTEEQLREYLKRLRFGGAPFAGADISPAGTASYPLETDGEGPSQPPIVQPEILQKFMQFAQTGVQPGARNPIPNTPEAPLSGSYLRNLNATLGTEGMTGPETLADLNMLRPPEVYDLPQDELARENFAASDAVASKMFREELEAEARRDEAKAKLMDAETNRQESQVLLQNPELMAKNTGAAEAYRRRLMRQGGASVSVQPPGGGGNPYLTEPGQEDLAAPTAPSAPAAPVNLAPAAGRRVDQATTPPEDVRPGDWTIRFGRRYVWTGQKWIPQ